MPPHFDPVGLSEIAERLGVAYKTVKQWRFRDLLPPPDAEVGGAPVWKWSTVRRWADDTGRLKQRREGEGDG